MSARLGWPTEPPPFTKTDLDKIASQGCAIPGCTCELGKLFFRSLCHDDHRGVDVSYLKDSGILTVSCAVCERLMLKIKIAES